MCERKARNAFTFKLVCLSLAIMAAGFSSACFREKTVREDGTRFTLGVLTPLTGGEANYGRSTQRGIDLALEELNRRLEGRGISFRAVYEDDQMNATTATSAIQKLINVDKVPVIIGPFGSSVVLAVAPIAERNKIVLVTASATADAIASAGEYIFRTVPPNRRQAEDVARFVRDHLGAKRASILYLNNDYGISLREAFEPAFRTLGGEIVSVDSFDSGATDFRVQLTRVKQVSPDIVFFPDHYKETALILKQAHELGVQTVFVGCDGACTDDLLRLAGSAAEGSYYSDLAADFNSTASEVRAFVTAFRDKYKAEPDAYSAYAYDTAIIVGMVMADQGGSAEAIKNGLHALPPFKGVTGTTRFDRNGEVDKSFAIKIVKNGKFELVQ